MAMTADGKIATANRAVHSFGSARDLARLYELRATADAVIAARERSKFPDRSGTGGAKIQKSTAPARTGGIQLAGDRKRQRLD